MKYKMQELECPVCHNKILFDIDQLLKGKRFICSNCKCSVSLSSSSSKMVEKTIEKYEQLTIKHNQKN